VSERSATDAWYEVIQSPLGPIFVGGLVEGLHRVDFMTDARDESWFIERLERDAAANAVHDPARAAEARAQLEAYFARECFTFDLPLAARGTPFQRRVWEALLTVPPGHTASYGEIAERIGRPSASRAVGAANGRNPLAIVVPCHRIIGAGGALTGYASGIERKRWLLDHEAAAMPVFARTG
jgi:methylated-DNA-[protein]-cysteine S-methyltransferase